MLFSPINFRLTKHQLRPKGLSNFSLHPSLSSLWQLTITAEEIRILSYCKNSKHLVSPSTSPTFLVLSEELPLALPRSAIPHISSTDEIGTEKVQRLNPKPKLRRMSLSLWRSRPKRDVEDEQRERSMVSTKKETKKLVDESATSEKKGIWKWKSIRALSHIGMLKRSCLFSVEVVTVHDLPASMNGLHLSVCVRKKESKDGGDQTMPSRVSQGAADFEETIHKESIEKSFEGARIRQWDTTFNLSGKAKGGELVLKLGFQIMEKDGGIGIYSQSDGQKSGKNSNSSPSIARRHSKSSFSVPSPRLTSRAEAWTPSQKGVTSDLQGIDDLNLDEPAPAPSTS
ncbi:unnamed protein product [Fraxinus pennsylvanica]|uniref:C2 NT-type domain-containing protein n=1 Tax=Fraxinus pennsylvanica TaxID=56036 RepID=A0AAD2E4N0_9LAMI|nr:unnamed protein product [Fraxinus pennsylvanica]